MDAMRMLSPWGRVALAGSDSGSDLGFHRDPATNVLRFGSGGGRLKKKKKMMVISMDRGGAETSSSGFVNGGLRQGRADDDFTNGSSSPSARFINGHGKVLKKMSTCEKSSNIVWHECSVGKNDRQNLLQQKGCVIWITGLSGSGKSTVACALTRILHSKGKLTYVLDGDNLRHGINRDLSFAPDDRAENIRRVGDSVPCWGLSTESGKGCSKSLRNYEGNRNGGVVAKLFADAGVICIASLISPYTKDRDACRALLPKGDFIEVFMNVPLEVCEARDPKGLYKLERAGKIKAQAESGNKSIQVLWTIHLAITKRVP